MKMKKGLPVLLPILLIALLWLGLNGRGQQRWDELHNTRLTFPDGLTVSGGAYGPMNAGPALTMRGGAFAISWDIESDGENAIRVTTANNAAIRLEEMTVSVDGQVQKVDPEEQFFGNELTISGGGKTRNRNSAFYLA